eukprot:11196125-Lingulodinium_polyedra.AAC.1
MATASGGKMPRATCPCAERGNARKTRCRYGNLPPTLKTMRQTSGKWARSEPANRRKPSASN